MIDVKKYKTVDNDGNKASKVLMIIFVLFVLIYIFGKGVSEYFNYIEVKEIGENFTTVFWKNFALKFIVQGIWFMIIFLVSMFSMLFARMNISNLSVDCGILKRKRNIVFLSILAGIFFSSAFSENLVDKYLMFANGGAFNIKDPVFGTDIGYYVFKRPFLVMLLNSLYTLWLSVSVVVFFAYFVFMSVLSSQKVSEFLRIKSIGTHNIVNIVVLIILKSFEYKFNAEDILFGNFGELVGAGCTDKLIWLNFYRVMPFLMIAITLLLLVFFYKNNYKNLIKTILVFPALWILTTLLSFGFQTIVVAPNEIVREKDNIADNIKYTKMAYNIDNIKSIDFDIKNDLQSSDIEQNKNTLDNVRVIDLDANLMVLNQIQGIRNYYKFNETDIIPYDINGEKTAVAITPREITKENLSDTADTYINKKLRYTHGFGLTVSPINRVSPQGHPEFYIKDIPPKSAGGVDEITQPRIYFGELTDDYVIVGSKKYKELDYSEGQEDIEFTYDGKAGVKLSFLNRVLFSAKYADFRLLVSNMFSSDSRILINRNITERLKKVAPFFEYDTDPYMIIDEDGSLKWIVDAYTSTSYFPYAQRTGYKNYIRNSVKAVIDAYNGDVKFYVFDKNDPIVNAYKKTYPGLFEEGDISESLKEHIKYPEYLFKIQSEIYAKYHIDNPTMFYNKNDMWVIAKEKYGSSVEEKNVAPYYNLMRVEDEKEDELLLTVPYTLKNKDNMVAQLSVRNSWNNYGHFVVYKFPKDMNVYGPMQIENRINADTEISSALTLWSQGGSKVIRGYMMIVPIKNSLLYVEPLYISSNSETSLPELKQVIVVYNEKVVMKNTLSEALYAIFGKSVPENFDEVINENDSENVEVPQGGEITYNEAANAVIQNFKAVKEASGNGNWEDFGKYMSELEKAVNELETNNTVQN